LQIKQLTKLTVLGTVVVELLLKNLDSLRRSYQNEKDPDLAGSPNRNSVASWAGVCRRFHPASSTGQGQDCRAQRAQSTDPLSRYGYAD
jgi:hypothetical protein